LRKEDKQMHKPLNMEFCFMVFGEAISVEAWKKEGM
jgi:hypothetical protein